jgi:hypothetical protein
MDLLLRSAASSAAAAVNALGDAGPDLEGPAVDVLWRATLRTHDATAEVLRLLGARIQTARERQNGK